MPIYGYRCPSCQREFEVLQRMTDPPRADCPNCGVAGTRLFYPAGIHFKGSGFYKTDSRSGAAAAPASNGDAAKPAPGTGAGDGAEKAPAKPATPSPATPSAAPTTPAPAAASKND